MTLLLRWLTLLALLCAPVAALAIDEKDLLPVDEAFVLTARATDADTITVEWRIADGYYLYRHRMSAQADGAGALVLPRGKAHTDEFFGRVETFRGAVRGTLDGVRAAPTVTLTVKYQGCADLGICYPPQTRTLQVEMPGAARTPASGGLAALGRALAGKVGAAQPGTDALPLPPEQAFGFEAIIGDGNTLLLRFTPARGYYLYRDRNTFRVEGAAGIAAAQPRWPQGRPHRDEYFGQTVVYFDQVDVPLPLARRTGAAAGATLVATFQGCQDNGICYPPMTRRVALSIPAGTIGGEPQRAAQAAAGAASAAGLPTTTRDGANAAATQAATDAAGRDRVAASPSSVSGAAQGLPAEAASTVGGAVESQAEDQRLAGALSGPGRWLALLGFFGAGLLLAFTPCVLPMIPILSGLIAGRGERIGAGHAFVLSLIYVLANAVVFTIAGVVAGLLGANLQIAFQTPWVLVLFAALFVALSLSMFGLYELQLPAAWRSRLGAISDHQRGGSWAGVAAMGALSALIVGPCVAPPLAAAVLYIGQAQDPVFGGLALFALAMGMGAPLLAFGVAAGRGLPTSGPWMVAVQRMFGFVFVGMAVWMLSRILPGAATLALYGLLALAFATWLAFQASGQARPGTGEGARWALRCAGLVFAIVGTAQLLGALAGGHDPLRPLAGVFGAPQARGTVAFRKIKSLADLQREVAAAQAAGKPLLFDFYADWCVSCKEMEKYTFPEPAVQAALAGFVLLKADVTANDAIDQQLMQALGIPGPPATLYYLDGQERRELRLFGFEKAEAFVRRVERVR